MRFQLPALPYPMGALEPHMSRETLEYHYGKHHKKYVDTLNGLVQGSRYDGASLTDIVRDAPRGKLFNNAAQVWNHTFFWESMTAKPKPPSERISGLLSDQFESVQAFTERFTAEAVEIFGTGWAWLAQRDDGSLVIVPEEDAGNPVREGYNPLLVCDVWEHAYYIDYRNERDKFLKAFWNVVDWDAVERRLQPEKSVSRPKTGLADEAARGEGGGSTF